MRAPVPSFKNALATYRKGLLAGNPPRDDAYRLIIGVLDRWERHANVEMMWDKIKPKLPVNDPAAPGLFIAGILKARIHAERVNRFVHKLPDKKQKVVSEIKRLTTEERFDELADRASWVRDVSKGRQKFSRKTDSAAQVDFMVALRSYFVDEWDQPFDDVVATLTNIAFDLRPIPPNKRRSSKDEEVNADHVRDAARAADRDIRPPK